MKQILIVDDDEDSAKVLSVILEKSGFESIVCDDGKKALNILKEQKIDLAFIDLFMPNIDGLETMKLIREFDSDVKIVIISGGSVALKQSTTITAFKSAPYLGADATLQKPVKKSEVIELVNSLLASSQV